MNATDVNVTVSSKVLRHERRRAGRDLADLGHPPRAYGASRVSTEEQAKGDSLDSQDSYIQDICADMTWDLREIFRRQGSASEFKAKDNHVYLDILEASQAGKPDVIVAREASRITRILVEGITLLDLWRDKDIKVYLYQDERLYDPSKPADRKALKEAFDAGENESATTSGRLGRSLTRLRKEKGRVTGRTPYGYVVHYHPVTQKPVRTVAVSCTSPGCKWWYNAIQRDQAGQAVTQCPECGGLVDELQAKLIREIIGLAADGLSLGSIAVRLNKRRIPPPTRIGRYGIDAQGRPLKAARDADGNPTGELVPVSKHGMWTYQTLLGIATNPVYIGKVSAAPAKAPRHYKREYGGPRDRDLGRSVDAPDYPRIIENDETFWRCHTRVNPAVREGIPNSYNGGPRDPGDGHQHEWTVRDGGVIACQCGTVRQSRPGAAAYDLTWIAKCSVHNAPAEVGNRSEVAPKDIPLNAIRDLMAACGGELAAAAPARQRYEHAAQDSADGISRVLRAAVAGGRLTPGTRLPSSRALADRLGMSRARVSAAYDQLTADGMLVSRPQSGFFVAGEAAETDGRRSYTGTYRRYYRCSSAKDVNVPMDEADAYIATLVADHLCKLWQQGGFTRRVTEERAAVQSDLKEAYESKDIIRTKMKSVKGKVNQAVYDALVDDLTDVYADIDRLEQRDKVVSVPTCLQVFMQAEGDLERTRVAYLALETEQRRAVLKELTAEIVLYPAKGRGRTVNDIADRVRVKEWAPWYVLSDDAATATDAGESVEDQTKTE